MKSLFSGIAFEFLVTSHPLNVNLLKFFKEFFKVTMVSALHTVDIFSTVVLMDDIYRIKEKKQHSFKKHTGFYCISISCINSS